jgi:DNA invertase Pin-like site-specific DNA recombinase
MALVGYARVSSVGQSLDVQLDKLQHCDKIYQEKKSGTSQQHSKLDACLEYVRFCLLRRSPSCTSDAHKVL